MHVYSLRHFGSAALHQVVWPSASLVWPPPALLVGVEDTPALQALLADPLSVVAYDRVPASAASGVGRAAAGSLLDGL
jgi:hypothetical protein